MEWEKVQYQLDKKGMSMYELAKRMGINRTLLSAMKAGRVKNPSFDLMDKMAAVLEISMDEFRSEITYK